MTPARAAHGRGRPEGVRGGRRQVGGPPQLATGRSADHDARRGRVREAVAVVVEGVGPGALQVGAVQTDSHDQWPVLGDGPGAEVLVHGHLLMLLILDRIGRVV